MPIKNVNPEQAKAWLDNEEAIIIDVREINEHTEVSINGSHLIPLDQVHIDSIPYHDNLKVIVHCKSGGRSARACTLLVQQNPDIAFYNLEGGILAWKQAGLPLKTN